MIFFLLLHMVGAYTCGPGSFNVNGACQNCSAGKYQPMSATSACLQCPQGQYQLASGSVACLQCPTSEPCCDGYGMVGDTCTQCQVGQYSGQLFGYEPLCVPCDLGQVAVRHRDGILTFGKTGSNACYDCPMGSHPVDNVCEPCSPGTRSINSECVPCPAGTSQPAHGSTTCEECPAGFLSDTAGAAHCTACPENTNASQPGSVACLECPTGRKSPTASDECFETCPLGTTDTGTACQHCPPGTYFSVDVCVHCADGFVKTHDYEPVCEQCVQSLPNADKTACEACPQGRYFSAQTCKECGQGTFGSWIVENISLLSCRNCPSGFAQDQTAQIACHMCLPGKYSYTEIECVDCPIGFVASSAGSSVCRECPSGTGANHSRECVPCEGSFGSINGVCSTCPAGKIANNGECSACPYGRVSNVEGSEQCDECPSGFYSYNTSQCLTCNASNHEYTNFVDAGSTHCIQCSDPTVACQTCGAGTYHDNGQCVACPLGRVNNGNRLCTECAEFTVPNEQQSDCTSCLPGFQAESSQCVACSAGKYSANDRCHACPLGQFQTNESALSCIECPIGKTTASEQTVYEYDCRTCLELGQASSTVILDHVCGTCSAGRVPSSTLDSCDVCPQGRHRRISESECHDCPTGTFSTNHEPCQECPTGFYNTKEGLGHCEQCLMDIGSGTMNICNECAAGYKRLEDQDSTRCEACLPGTFSLVGQTECQSCSAGQYQDQSASSSCQTCSAGQYQDAQGQLTCKFCPAGQFQSLTGQGACHACPVSQYATSQGSIECLSCPPGTTTLTEGSDSASLCIQCPQGYAESSGICEKCFEGRYQDVVGQVSCKSCASGETSLMGATSSNDCFSLGGMVSYVFGMKSDSKQTQSHTKMCEIRPNGILLCPGCTCDSDSRNGFWDSPICDECRRGFATRTCKVGCAGYDGVHDSTMCHGNGRCWFGKFGNGLCYCGGHSEMDAESENIVVDVQYCPKGQICPNYGLTEQVETVYRPIYYIILYRQFSAFVLQLNEYTPVRGHMWFQRFPRNAAYENKCSACTGGYQKNVQTSVGYYAKDGTYQIFKENLQTKNGFHGENCQHECGLCLSGGRCHHTPHADRYAYSIVDTFRPQKTVYIAKTTCACPSLSMDSEHMCCPNGFQPYVYYGVRDSMPYSRFTKLPLVTSTVNERREFWIRRDILLETQKKLHYAEPASGLQWVGGDRGTFTQQPFADVGVYDTHPFYGIPQDICRACPGLFGKGVRSASSLIENEAEAKEFWWDNAIGATSRKCNGVGVCDFYAKEREKDVHFMGDANSYLKHSLHHKCGGPNVAHSTFENNGLTLAIQTIHDCASAALQNGATWFAFSETYKGGSTDDMFRYGIEHGGYPPNYNSGGSIRPFDGGEFPENTREQNIANCSTACRAHDPNIKGFLVIPDTGRCYCSWVRIDPNDLYNESGSYKSYDLAEADLPYLWPTKSDAQQHAFNTNAIGYASFVNDSTLKWAVLDPSVVEMPIPDSSSGFELYRTENHICESYDTCDVTVIAPGTNVYTFAHGRGDDRLPTATFDRFDTCFTYTWNGTVQLFDSSYTKDYVQGDDPFLGGLCPKGHFCSMHADVGYKEACPAGYFQPDIGRTRTVTETQCSKELHQTKGCVPRTTTNTLHDYVDSVCQRCPRQMWSPPGAYACTECPVGRVKKISGIFDTSTPMLNMPTAASAYHIWYYQSQETGIMNEDCALVPSGMVHIAEADSFMKYTAPNFLPVMSCPYGYSTQPGTSVGNQFADFGSLLGSKLSNDESLVQPPFAQIETVYRTGDYGKKCAEMGFKQIKTMNDCRVAANSIGIFDVRERPGLFQGCWSSSVREDVVFWGTNGHHLCVPSVRYMCLDAESLTSQWSNFVRNICFRCPGTSVSGPESGSCTNCFANNMKAYTKESIQKISENALVPMKHTNGNDVNVNIKDFKNVVLTEIDEIKALVTLGSGYNMNKEQARTRCAEAGRRLCLQSEVGLQSLCNYGWMEDTEYPGYWHDGSASADCGNGWMTTGGGGNAHCCLVHQNQTILEPKTNVKLSLPDCYTACQSIGQTLTNIGIKSDSTQCSCGLSDDSVAEWTWYAVSYDQWTNAQPLCSNCQPGQYSDGDCKNCPAGFYTSSSAESNTGQCQACDSGNFQPLSGQTVCLQCPSGFAQAFQGQGVCDACSQGTYQTQMGGRSCLHCPQGFRQPSTGQIECITCPVGKYDNLEDSECTACSPGKYQDVSSALNCKPCAVGTFSVQNASTNPCEPCVAGQYQSQTGQTSCTSCAIGTFSAQVGATSTCTACPSGWYAAQNGQMACTPCPGAFKCSQTSVGELCPFRTYLPELTWTDECDTCPPEEEPDRAFNFRCVACSSGKTTRGLSGQVCVSCPNVGWKGIEAWNGMEFQTQNVSELSHGLHYVSVAAGFCTDHNEPFADVLAIDSPLYDTDRVQECMLRCSNASFSHFDVRLSDNQCACSAQCDEQTASSQHQSFMIAESQVFAQTFDVYVVALSTGVREFTFYDVDDSATLETWQQGASTGHYQMTPFATTTIQETWDEGTVGHIKITCGNAAGLYNCHFKITKDGSFPDFAFYTQDPGSNYCTLQT